MSLYFKNDTIAAVSTAPGTGAVAIIRISGSEAEKIVSKIVIGKDIIAAPARTVVYAAIFDPHVNEKVDNVLLLKFKNPRSYTGEDVIEIHCHGGVVLTNKILNLLITCGARMAQPGEFTYRAFLNGKMDLLQAESVASIIHSQTEKSLEQSFKQLQGFLSEKVNSIKGKLKKQCALLELELDFSEDDVNFVSRQEILSAIEALCFEIDALLSSYKYGKILNEGVNTVIVGKPNVGKSSLLNRLLEEERAIVSEIPGTTRDSIEEALDIDGVLFRISDTAGIRKSSGEIEKIGIERTKKILSNAQLVLAVFDANSVISEEDRELIKLIESLKKADTILLINKIDLKRKLNKQDMAFNNSHSVLEISAKTGEGLPQLKRSMVKFALNEHELEEGVHISKARHKSLLDKCKMHLLNAKESVQQNLSSEYIALDLREALSCMGELTGEVTTQEILDTIFSSFCIGK